MFFSARGVFRLQVEVKLQRQQLSDSHHLLQSLRVELQVYEKMKNESNINNGTQRPFWFSLYFEVSYLIFFKS